MGKQSRESQNSAEKPVKTKEVKKQKKQKPAKAEEGQQDILVKNQSKANNQIQDESSKIPIWYEELRTHLSKKVASIASLYKKLEEFGMSDSTTHQIQRLSRVGERAEKASQSLISTYVVDSQNEIFDAQRGLFKKVSDLERAQQKIKNLLTATQSLSLEQINEVMEHIDKKTEQLKGNIYHLNKVVELGDEALGKSKHAPQQ